MKTLKLAVFTVVLVVAFIAITIMPNAELFLKVMCLFAGFACIGGIFVIFQANISKESYEKDLMDNYIVQHNAKAEIARAELAQREAALKDDYVTAPIDESDD